MFSWLLRTPNGFSFLALAVLLTAFFSLKQSVANNPNNCQMVYMYESYATLSGFNSRFSRMGSKYSLLYYREGNGVDTDTIPSGIPVLFIPGNAGSYRQARSLASYCSNADKSLPRLDFFTADFKEDFTAFHGRTLLDQAEYLNDAIEYILSLYEGTDSVPAPSSVIVIGHSMGGIVARTLLTLPNYVQDSINTIITLSTPHVLPPLSFDRDLVLIYEKVNQYWRYSSSDPLTSRSPLGNVALISLTGGQSDNMVPSDLTSVSSIVYPDHGFTTFTYTIPDVWLEIDHLAIVWCGQLRDTIGRALLALVDPYSGTKTKPLGERMAVLKSHFLSEMDAWPLEFHQEETKVLRGYKNNGGRKKHFDERYPISTNLSLPAASFNRKQNQPIHITGLGSTESGDTSLFRMPISLSQKENYGIITNASFDDFSVYLCEVPGPHGSLENTQALYDYSASSELVDIQCYDVKNYLTIKLPASYPDSETPSDDYGNKAPMNFYVFDPKLDTKHDFQSLVVYVNAEQQTSSFLRVETVDMGFQKIDSGSRKLLFDKSVITLSDALYHDVSISIADTALITYKVVLHTDDSWCRFDETNYHSPLIRQYIPDPLEGRFHVNVDKKPIRVHSHGPRSPYTPYKLAGFGDNLHLQVFVPPVMCPQGVQNTNIQLEISIDIWASLGNIVMRYRTLLAAFPLAVTLLCFLNQLNHYSSEGEFPSFSEASDLFAKKNLIDWVYIMVFLYIALGIEFIRSVLKRFELFYDPENDRALNSFNPYLRQNELFLGISDLRFAMLGPVFLVVALGLTNLADHALKFIVHFFCMIHRRYVKSVPKNDLDTPLSTLKGSLKLEKKKRPYLIGFASAASLLLYYVPYQVLFMVLSIFHIVYNIPRAIVSVNGKFDVPSHNLSNFSYSLGLIFIWVAVINGPFLAVWFHNFSLQWTIVFATYHNIPAILPQLGVILLMSKGKMIPRQDGYTRTFTTFLLKFTILYAFLFGMVNAYMMHHLVLFVCLWFLILHFDRKADYSGLIKNTAMVYQRMAVEKTKEFRKQA